MAADSGPISILSESRISSMVLSIFDYYFSLSVNDPLIKSVMAAYTVLSFFFFSANTSNATRYQLLGAPERMS